jgi:gas vesicle protein
MLQENGYIKGFFFGFLTGGLISTIIALFYSSKSGKSLRKDIKNKTDSIISHIKDDNALQINIMGSAGIPKNEMPNYALSSVADGKILREYVNEIKSGEINSKEAVKMVKNDYEKMKSGEKEGKFVTPSN